MDDQDKKSLIKLASTLPLGSNERRVILAGLKTANNLLSLPSLFENKGEIEVGRSRDTNGWVLYKTSFKDSKNGFSYAIQPLKVLTNWKVFVYDSFVHTWASGVSKGPGHLMGAMKEIRTHIDAGLAAYEADLEAYVKTFHAQKADLEGSFQKVTQLGLSVMKP